MGFAVQNGHGHGCRHNSNSSDPPNRPNEPAYEGAKFDVTGHCLKHPEIRMCRPKQQAPKKSAKENDKSPNHPPEMKYVIVRKTCHLCGEHALRNERKLNKKSWAHGYEPIKLAPRKASPKGMMVKADIHVKTSRTSSTRCSSSRSGKVLPTSPTTRSPHPTPPSSPDSARRVTKELTVKKLVNGVSPPTLPGRGRQPGGRVRLKGVIPAGPPLTVRFSPPQLVCKSQKSIKSDTSNESSDRSSDNSGGSKTERHSNMIVQRSKSERPNPDIPESIIKRLEHVQV